MPGLARKTDGSIDFSGGVDSGKVTTLISSSNPNGLRRNQLAWLTNGTVRGGGIVQVPGWKKIARIHPGGALYQGGSIYVPDTDLPHLILSIGGTILRVNVDTDNSVTDISAATGLSNPPDQPEAHFVQGEQFLVIQAGDLSTLPLFYWGTGIRRSNGIAGQVLLNREIPPAESMDYYMGRLWYSGVPNNRTYCAGDIVKGPTGTVPFQLRDSILHVSENPVATGGDGFVVPTNAGGIRALRHSANLDTALGEGQLYVFTRKQVYALTVPVTRALWATTTEPLQRVAQITNGAWGDRCVVNVNGDLYYQAPDGIRSLTVAIRYFQQPGNTPISRNENRVLDFNNRGLMRYSSGIEYDNRMWQTAGPIETPVGVAFKYVVPLDFDLISSLDNKLPPAWEGVYEGIDILQLFTGDFGGLQRAFAVVHSRIDGAIDLWELTLGDRFDNIGNNPTDITSGDRKTWGFVTPAYTWDDEFLLKELEGLELWIDRLYGTVDFLVEYRPDSDPCWHHWFAWQMCSARNSCEDVENPVCYPLTPYGENYRSMARLPKPQINDCARAVGVSRPAHIGYQFQLRLTIKGFCRIRGLLLHCFVKDDEYGRDMLCTVPFGPSTLTVMNPGT